LEAELCPELETRTLKWVNEMTGGWPIGQDVAANCCHVIKAHSVIMIKTLDLCERSAPNCCSTILFFFYFSRQKEATH